MEFRDLKTQYHKHKGLFDQAVIKVMEKGQFIGGQEVDLFEERLRNYVGVKHCISCANGTEAMTLLMMAWEIGPGDAVFVPDFTFFSTAEIVAFRGATPVFVNVDSRTFNMDPVQLEKQIEHILSHTRLKPKCIIPVDLFGLPANYIEIRKIADKYDLKILEDAAQGFGGSINGKIAGSFGDAATTSFFPAKPLGAYGDGGAIFTDDDDLAKKLSSLKVHGKGSDKYDNIQIGVNSRLDTLQAAILNVKLDLFEAFELEAVNSVRTWYDERLLNNVILPLIPEGYGSSYAQYTIILKTKDQRDGLKNYLAENNIPTMVYYPIPLHKQTAFKDYVGFCLDKNETKWLCERVLSLPMHPYLSLAEVDEVCEHIKKFLAV